MAFECVRPALLMHDELLRTMYIVAAIWDKNLTV